MKGYSKTKLLNEVYEPYTTEPEEIQNDDIDENETCVWFNYCYVHKKSLGYFLALLYVLSASSTTVLIRMLTFSLNPAEIMTIRYACVVIIVTLLLIKDRNELTFCRSNFLMLVLMSISDSIGALCSHYAFAALSVAEATVICNCRILITLPLAKFLLKEDVGIYEIMVALLSTAGFVVTVQPQTLFENVDVPITKTRAFGIMFCILSLIFNSIGKVMTRKLKHVHFDFIIFGPAISAMILGAVMTVTIEGFQDPTKVEGAYILVILVMLGVIGTASQTASLQMLLANDSSIISMFRSPLSTILEVILIGYIPTTPTLVGMAMTKSTYNPHCHITRTPDFWPNFRKKAAGYIKDRKIRDIIFHHIIPDNVCSHLCFKIIITLYTFITFITSHSVFVFLYVVDFRLTSENAIFSVSCGNSSKMTKVQNVLLILHCHIILLFKKESDAKSEYLHLYCLPLLVSCDDTKKNLNVITHLLKLYLPA
ncbi:hypothetical protein GQR58_013940 [Nymphon striatum]|nr:hypothetical protein GQR58_013940 [Nymphon striatum]